MTVRYEIGGGVCVVTLDNPPVNVIGQEMRRGLGAALQAAEAAGVARVIITGAGKVFAAGADAREFGGPPAAPHLPDILARLERLPSIAAINGAALGGGLEIALACRFRIAAPHAVLGLPEVTLGVVPGAGGTQRLPRLIGVAAGAKLIAQGQRIPAEEAAALGMLDAVEADALAAALALPDAVLAASIPACERPMPAPAPEAIDQLRRTAARRSHGQTAPGVALDLVAASARLPFGEALALERRNFLALRQDPQAAALRHVFFAETAAKARARSLGADARRVETAIVVGGGTMGAAIAYALDGVGIATTLVESGPVAARRARGNLAALFDQAVARGRSGAGAAEAGKARIAVITGYDGLPPADLAIEAVFENLEVKQEVFAALDNALPADTILATNTSYLDVNRVFRDISNPERCLGLHFFSPAHVMKLLEIIRADATGDDTLASAFALGARLGKVAVESGICDGFIGNRILTRYRQICDVMLIEGALPAQVDRAMVDFGMAMGPYAVQDLSGLDIAHANRQRKNLRADPGIRYVPIADRMVEDLMRLGRKTGAGWYDYPPDGPARPSPEVEELVLAASAEAGIARRSFSDEEIVARATTAMIDEGLRILDEGIARRPADIDLVLVHGYGFPRWRGGVMHHADGLGVAALRDRIRSYAEADPLSWRAPPLLDRLIADGRGIEHLNHEQDGSRHG